MLIRLITAPFLFVFRGVLGFLRWLTGLIYDLGEEGRQEASLTALLEGDYGAGSLEEVMETVDRMDGYQFEVFGTALLKKCGFEEVEKTKGSGDQGVDILAQKDEVRFAVQCKHVSSRLGNTPVQEVAAGKVLYRCHVAAVLTNSDFTQAAEELARANLVLLWDRKHLMDMIAKGMEKAKDRG